MIRKGNKMERKVVSDGVESSYDDLFDMHESGISSDSVSVGGGGGEIEDQMEILKSIWKDDQAKPAERIKAMQEYNGLRREVERASAVDVRGELVRFLKVVKGGKTGGNPLVNGAEIL